MSQDWNPDFASLSRTAPAWPPKRPVRIALLGDFGAGAARGRLSVGAELAGRKPVPVEFDTLEDALARFDLTVSLGLTDGAQIHLPIGELESFHPDALYRSLDVFAGLASLRRQLQNPATQAKAAEQVLSWATGAEPRASSAVPRSARGLAPSPGARLSDFARLLDAEREAAAQTPVDDLVRRIVAPFVVQADNPQKGALVTQVDAALGDALRAVLHHPDFQAAESLWRGVDFLLRRLETGPQLQVHLIDVSAEEFAADLSRVSDLGDSGLYQLLVDGPSQDKLGGYSLVCGLYQFEATPPHAELLGRMARIASHAGAPFVTGMSIDGLTDRKRLPHPLVQQALRALQALPEAGFLSLMGPRFMLRHPYGKRSDPIASFEFEEFSRHEGLRSLLWGHPALLAACAVAGPDGLHIGDLPFHHHRDAQGDTVALPCTDRLVTLDMATALRAWGVVPLLAHKGAPELRLAGLDAVNGQPMARASVAQAAQARAGVTVSVGKTVTMTAVLRTASAAAAAPRPASGALVDDREAAMDGTALGDASPEAPDGPGEDAAAPGTDAALDELDALLASLDDPGPVPAPAGADDIDPELAALLASLE